MGLAPAVVSAPDIAARTIEDPPPDTHLLTSPCARWGRPQGLVWWLFLMNSLETTMGGENTEEALSSLPRQQLKHRAAQGHLKMLTVAVHGVDPLCSAAPR